MRELLDKLRAAEGPAAERGLLIHRTLADPRFLDATIEPNDRAIGMCFLSPADEPGQHEAVAESR